MKQEDKTASVERDRCNSARCEIRAAGVRGMLRRETRLDAGALRCASQMNCFSVRRGGQGRRVAGCLGAGCWLDCTSGPLAMDDSCRRSRARGGRRRRRSSLALAGLELDLSGKSKRRQEASDEGVTRATGGRRHRHRQEATLAQARTLAQPGAKTAGRTGVGARGARWTKSRHLEGPAPRGRGRGRRCQSVSQPVAVYRLSRGWQDDRMTRRQDDETTR